MLSGRAGRFDDWQTMVEVLMSLLPPEREDTPGRQPGTPSER